MNCYIYTFLFLSDTKKAAIINHEFLFGKKVLFVLFFLVRFRLNSP